MSTKKYMNYSTFNKDNYIFTNQELSRNIPNYIDYEIKTLITCILSDIVYYPIEDIIYQQISPIVLVLCEGPLHLQE